MVSQNKNAGETLLGHSSIWIFGRELEDIKINIEAYRHYPIGSGNIDANNTVPRAGSNNFLLNQMRHGQDPIFARIYSFSYEGQIYDMQRPAIFLVHGEGIDPEGPSFRTPRADGDVSRRPPHVGRTGAGSQTGNFASGIRAWAYDRADFTVRLDIDNGSFDSVLLAHELGSADGMSLAAGSLARSAGSLARSAGSLTRSAGSLARSRSRGGTGGSE